ncbi:MAG: DNA primase [Alphaproteobacteria bacterium]|nr:DNA primase [Alphaproteobacteria bacterium]
MAKFDNNFVDELRMRLSIVDIVGRRVPLVKKGQNYWGCCPFHNEKTPSFSVAEEKGFYHCFGCGAHGDIISFVMNTEHLEYPAAIRELADMAGMKMPEYKPKSPARQKMEDSYFEIIENATKLYQQLLFEPAGADALNYVRGRGFTDDMIKKYRIGYAPKNNIITNKFSNLNQSNLLATGLVRRGEYGMYDFFRHKLMFPIFDAHGKVVAFSGRSLDGSEPKYINTTDTELFHKRQTIFGFNFARDEIYKKNRSIVVEGQIDAIQMQMHGFGETVAPLGTALTDDHIAILCKSNRNIIFCFDGDNAGQKAAARAASIVLPFVRDNSDVRFAFVVGGKDPDEVLKTGGVAAMHKIIDDATPLIDFLWNWTNQNFLVSTPGGRAQAEKFLDTELKKITDKKLQYEIEQEYKKREFQQWRSWKKTDAPKIKLPDTDLVTKNTLVYIVNNFPDIASQYADFLSSLNISFDVDAPDLGWDARAAEKFIVSLKLQRYRTALEQELKIKMQGMINGENYTNEELSDIKKKIAEINEKLEKLLYME